MLSTRNFPKYAACVGSLALATTLVPGAQAATITAQLTCSLNNLNAGDCGTFGNFGTVTLDDSVGNGDIEITVNLLNSALKFRDLMVAFDGVGTGLTEDDAGNIVTYSLNGFSINPYNGTFDIGGSGGQGWAADSPYMAILSASGNLDLADFLSARDSLNNLSVALHIQNIGSSSGGDCDGSGTIHPCVPGKEGPGSLKIGGVFEPDGDIPDIPEIPEPSTILLMGAGLLGLGYWRQRRNS